MAPPPRHIWILGKGGFGSVIAATLNGTAVAVKTTKTAKNRATFHKQLLSISNELQIFRKLRHPNIVLFFGACIDASSGEIALVHEQLHGKTLQDFICVPPALPDTRRRHHLILDVCSALRYLHSHQPCIVHGDLKGSNVFVEFLSASTPRAKLLDFGLSRLVTRHVAPLGGTRAWKAPEITDRTVKPGPAADIFSLGLLARFVVTGVRPEEGQSNLVIPSSEVGLSRECSMLCHGCLQWEAIRRPDMATVHATVLAWQSGVFDTPQCHSLLVSFVPRSAYSTGTQTVTLQDALRQVRESLWREETPKVVLGAAEDLVGSGLRPQDVDCPVYDSRLPPRATVQAGRSVGFVDNGSAVVDVNVAQPSLREIPGNGTNAERPQDVSISLLFSESSVQSTEPSSGLIHVHSLDVAVQTETLLFAEVAVQAGAYLPPSIPRHRQPKGPIRLRTRKLARPQLRETPNATIEQMLWDILFQMNPRGKGCCYMHVGLAVLQQCISNTAMRQCNQSVQPHSGFQCAECFAVNLEDSEECIACLCPAAVLEHHVEDEQCSDGESPSASSDSDTLVDPASVS